MSVDSLPMLDQAAIDGVHLWSFTPARDADGDPVRVLLEGPRPLHFAVKYFTRRRGSPRLVVRA